MDAEAVAFVSWMLQDNGTALALEGEGVALLATISPAVRAANTLFASLPQLRVSFGQPLG